MDDEAPNQYECCNTISMELCLRLKVSSWADGMGNPLNLISIIIATTLISMVVVTLIGMAATTITSMYKYMEPLIGDSKK